MNQMSDYNSIRTSRDPRRETVESVPRIRMRHEYQGKGASPSCLRDLRQAALLFLIGIAAAMLPTFCQGQTTQGYVITTVAGNGTGGSSG